MSANYALNIMSAYVRIVFCFLRYYGGVYFLHMQENKISGLTLLWCFFLVAGILFGSKIPLFSLMPGYYNKPLSIVWLFVAHLLPLLILVVLKHHCASLLIFLILVIKAFLYGLIFSATYLSCNCCGWLSCALFLTLPAISNCFFLYLAFSTFSNQRLIYLIIISVFVFLCFVFCEQHISKALVQL